MTSPAAIELLPLVSWTTSLERRSGVLGSGSPDPQVLHIRHLFVTSSYESFTWQLDASVLVVEALGFRP
eukprot:2167132-Amphidinium_carterae.1